MKDNQKSFYRNINQYTDQTASRVPLLATRFVWMFCSSTRVKYCVSNTTTRLMPLVYKVYGYALARKVLR